MKGSSASPGGPITSNPTWPNARGYPTTSVFLFHVHGGMRIRGVRDMRFTAKACDLFRRVSFRNRLRGFAARGLIMQSKRIATIRKKMKEGHYDRPEIIAVVAYELAKELFEGQYTNETQLRRLTMAVKDTLEERRLPDPVSHERRVRQEMREPAGPAPPTPASESWESC